MPCSNLICKIGKYNKSRFSLNSKPVPLAAHLKSTHNTYIISARLYCLVTLYNFCQNIHHKGLSVRKNQKDLHLKNCEAPKITADG